MTPQLSQISLETADPFGADATRLLQHMQRHITILLLVLIQFVCASCSRHLRSEFFPKPIKGSSRVFSLMITASVLSLTNGTMTVRTEEEVELQGKKYLKTVAIPSGVPGLPVHVEYRRHGVDGIWVIEDTAKDRPEYCEVPFPVTIGRQWSYTTPDGTIQLKAETIEDLQLPNKTVKGCLKVSRSKTDTKGVKEDGYVYYAPTLGDVKIAIKSERFAMEAVLTNPAP